MAISSYQIGRLLSRLREWHHGPRRLAALPERVSLSADGAMHLDSRSPSSHTFDEVLQAAGGAPTAHHVSEAKSYPGPVDYELERRAGSFMNPPYPSFGPPSSIPKSGGGNSGDPD